MYPWNFWKNHVTNPQNAVRLIQIDGDLYAIEPITSGDRLVQLGTPMTDERFNNHEIGISNAYIAASLLLNFARQRGWALDDVISWMSKVNKVYTGTDTLSSTEHTVSIGETLANPFYDVEVKITDSSGEVGEVVISDKLTNGFKLAITGSGSASVKWAVIPKTTVSVQW